MSGDFIDGRGTSRRTFLGVGAAGLAAAGTTAFTKTDPRVPAALTATDASAVQQQLGLLANLAGAWEGTGFNLVARPDFHDGVDTYLQLNQTRERLTITPIESPFPDRGFGQDDIELLGLNYLQRVEDAATGGLLHFEPGLWMTQPQTSYPEETAGPGEQIIFRMGSIPHGTTLLAEGVASAFTGSPTLLTPTEMYAFSTFPSFNSTPFPVPPSGNPAVSAAGTSVSENGLDSQPGTSQQTGVQVTGITEYNLNVPASQTNPRTPFDTDPPDPPLPASIDGVPMQAVVNDPIALLQAVINSQVAEGCAFSGVALNIATQAQITFDAKKDQPTGGTITVSQTDGGGSLGNTPFLLGAASEGPNAQSALVYATFWIEQVESPTRGLFMQLQYAQFVQLNFGLFNALHHPAAGQAPVLALNGWPHVSVATLRKSFG
jgi:hypothetical protein